MKNRKIPKAAIFFLIGILLCIAALVYFALLPQIP